MKKKANLLIYLPVVVVGFGVLGSWFTLQADNTTTKAKVAEIKEDLKETEDDTKEEIDDLKKENGKLEKSVEVNKTQQENTDKKVEEISVKTDKIIDLLMQMQKKK